MVGTPRDHSGLTDAHGREGRVDLVRALSGHEGVEGADGAEPAVGVGEERAEKRAVVVQRRREALACHTELLAQHLEMESTNNNMPLSD